MNINPMRVGRVAPVSPAPLIPPGRLHGLHAYTLERSGQIRPAPENRAPWC
jgi:hypothetical protein